MLPYKSQVMTASCTVRSVRYRATPEAALLVWSGTPSLRPSGCLTCFCFPCVRVRGSHWFSGETIGETSVFVHPESNTNFICNIRPQKTETHRVHMTAGSDKLDYPGDASSLPPSPCSTPNYASRVPFPMRKRRPLPWPRLIVAVQLTNEQ